MEYKTSFFVGMFANLYTYFITYLTFWILVNRFSSIGGWNFEEVSVLYGLNLLTYAISGTLFWYSIYYLEDLASSGRLDGMLVRPMGIITQLACQKFGHTFLGQILITMIFIIPPLWNRLVIDGSFLKIGYLISILISGVMLHAGAVILVGALSIKTLHSTSVGQIVYYDIRNFINYPLNIYPGFLKVILTFIFPWAFINYYPSLIILDKVQSPYDLVMGILSPVVGISFFMLSLYIFQKGLRSYSSSGS
jgi:ABC-2 type transport system permease protein